MSLSISKGWLATFLVTTVLSVVVLMKPDPVATESTTDIAEDLRASTSMTEGQAGLVRPWVREARDVPHIKKEVVATKPVAPLLAALPATVPLEVARPVAPNPAFSYLGKMKRDGKVYVFLGNGEEVTVAAVGDALDDNWRIEGADGAEIELRYLPLNELKKLAMSGNR